MVTPHHLQCFWPLLALKYLNEWLWFKWSSGWIQANPNLPVPLSMKRTLEIGKKFEPLSRSSSPPSTEQEVRLTDSMTGSSWAERWAEARTVGKIQRDIPFQLKYLWFLTNYGHPKRCCISYCRAVVIKTSNSQHSMGREATWRARTRPGGATGGARGRCVRNTKRTRVFFLPTSVSPFLSSMSEFLSFRMPAQSMLQNIIVFYSKFIERSVERAVVDSLSLFHSHCCHVVLRVEGDVEQLGPRLDALMTGSAHHLPCHPERRHTTYLKTAALSQVYPAPAPRSPELGDPDL